MKKITLLIAILVFALLGIQAQEDISGTITIWGWDGPIVQALGGSGVRADFEAAYPDVTIVYESMSAPAVYEALRESLADGTPGCDICLIEDKELGDFVQMGGLTDLTDLLTPYLELYPEWRLAQLEQDGVYYAMPWDSGPVVMFYRRDVFEQAGLPTEPEEVEPLVATWDDYLEVCRTIQEETELDCFTHNRADNNARLFQMVLWSRGLGFFDPVTGEVVLDSPAHIETLEMLGQFWEEDLVSDSLEWTSLWYSEFSSLEAPSASFIYASWMEGHLKSRAAATEGLWGIVRMPAFDEDGSRAAIDGGSNLVIPEASDNQEAARAFVEFVLGSEDHLARMFAQNGAVPVMSTAWEEDIFSAPDPFFAGQESRQVYIDVLNELPEATLYVPEFALVTPYLVDNLRLYATGELTAEEALTAAADGIRAELETE